LESGEFPVDGESLWEPSCWRVLNFIFCQRCGFAVPGVHSSCHTGLFSRHNGRTRPYAGGWHDAGDLSQQTLQTADVVYSLLELYERRRADNPQLASRLLEEALWGLDFVLRQHLGDGYHASSMGLLLWQDNDVDSHDDIFTVRVQNCAYDNYLYAAYLAYAARIIEAEGSDPMLAGYLRGLAQEDYACASRDFALNGYGGWINPYEHTYCTGPSQWEATASWAASQLYMLTGDDSYAAEARRHASYVLSCQQMEPVADGGLYGFFYRDTARKSVVHFIHQSREQLFMQALTALCGTQADHPDFVRWHAAVEAYGSYIKGLMKYSAPYGMIPAGIYHQNEYADSAAFYSLHLFPPADATERYKVQIANGVNVAPGWYVKRFPVWFNIFNGNLAVHMSMGKAAALCARCLDDAELRRIAAEQLYWTVGKNPFAQSLIYGEGRRFPSLNNFSSGEQTGAMPVGIRSLGDSDEPYWPNINNACYKEVWVTSAGKWLSLIAEL
ncbi:MAG: glycoside hydrolase family 9 protein, partial [Muribaculaceae bacterium]|nr:glycoside hydrolase family 9 protein [Muribaculaceae bacterium]